MYKAFYQNVLIIILLLMQSVIYGFDVKDILPDITELPGGEEHWISGTLPQEQTDRCKIYSATYAYFTNNAKPLFDIPRNNIYSINIRFYLCDNIAAASEIYDRFSKVGDDKFKKEISIGDKGILFINPSVNKDMTGDFYLTSITKYIVMQIHADDGFALMDIAGLMNNRLETYLAYGSGKFAESLTVNISKEGYLNSYSIIPLNKTGSERIKLSGILFDQNNTRVDNATIRIMETGTTIKTDPKGEFVIELGADKGNELILFYPLTINKILPADIILNGFYNVDINYRLNGKIGKDHWKININGDRITGSSLNLATNTILDFYGYIKENNITINRKCGNNAQSGCFQKFTGVIDSEGITGEWSGTGGGGTWELNKDSFELDKIRTSPKDNGYEIKGTKRKNGWLVDKKNSIKLTTPKKIDDDFYFVSRKIIFKINTDKKIYSNLVLYSDNSTTPVKIKELLIPGKNGISKNEISLDTLLLDNNMKYVISFDKESDDSIQLDPIVENTYAKLIPHKNSGNIIKNILINLNAEDIAGFTKAITSNNIEDISIDINIQAKDKTLQGIEIKSKGNMARQWNTYTGNIFPGVAVTDEFEKIINNADGTLNYKLSQPTAKFTLNIDKGSIIDKDITGFEIIFLIDGIKINSIFNITNGE